jgi:hypothetical protein
MADPTTIPTAWIGKQMAIPSTKRAPVRAFSWNQICPIPRNTTRIGSGIGSVRGGATGAAGGLLKVVLIGAPAQNVAEHGRDRWAIQTG